MGRAGHSGDRGEAMATYSKTGSPMDEVEIPDCPVHDSGRPCDDCGGFIPDDAEPPYLIGAGDEDRCIHPGAYELISQVCLNREWCNR